MPLKLTILGSGSAVPNLNRGVTAQFLNFNERRILIDCGEGTQLQLRRFKVKFQRLQYVFISHLHGDHFLGLFGLVSSMSLLGRTKKLKIFAPEGLEEVVRHQFKVTNVYLDFELEFITVKTKAKTLIFEDNSIEVYALPLKHRAECYGYLFNEKEKDLNIDKSRIKEFKLTLDEILAAKRGEDVERKDKVIPNSDITLTPEPLASYAFCTDTSYIPHLADWIKNVRLLYHEATFTNAHLKRAKATGHSTAEQAALIAIAAGAEQLILGHFSSRYKETSVLLEEAKPIFDKVLCVEDGQSFHLK
jgi:ribonuclease Z